MYIVNPDKKSILPIEKKTFGELKLTERWHLQEWIAGQPSCLGEELLIIQKEYDQFEGTKERIDLLALNKQGQLVVIENKLDDSGRDVTWQALKYASYCSTFTAEQIREAYQKYLGAKGDAAAQILEFLGKDEFSTLQLNDGNPSIYLVAGDFRKEVTSTVLWLNKFNLDIKCFKATPYLYQGSQILLEIDQVIPLKESADFQVKAAERDAEAKKAARAENDLKQIRKRYWISLLNEFQKVSPQFSDISPSAENWIQQGAGVTGVSFQFVATTGYADVHLNITQDKVADCKWFFDRLEERKADIEQDVGHELLWERLDGKTSRIGIREDACDVREENSWPKIRAFHCKWMPRLEKALRGRLAEINKKFKTLPND